MVGVKSASVAQLEQQIVGNDAELRSQLEFMAWKPNHSLTPGYGARCRILRMMIQKCLDEYRLRTGKDYPYAMPAMPMIVKVDPRTIPRGPAATKPGSTAKPPTPPKSTKYVQRPIQYIELRRHNIVPGGTIEHYSIVVERWGSIPLDSKMPYNIRQTAHWREKDGLMSWTDISRHTAQWRAETAGDKAISIGSKAANYGLLLAGQPGNTDPRQHVPNLGKKHGGDHKRLGIYESWEEYKKKNTGDDDLSKYRNK